MDLDIQGNKKTILRGSFGYVSYVKKQSFRTAITILLIALLIFFVGTTYVTSYESMFIVVSMIMFVPASQYLARYLSFRVYKETDKETFERFESISDEFVVVGGLPIIDGKKTFFYKVMVITPHGIYGFIGRNSKIEDAKRHLESVLHTRGHLIPITIYHNKEDMYEALKRLIKSSVGEGSKRQEAILEELIRKTH